MREEHTNSNQYDNDDDAPNNGSMEVVEQFMDQQTVIIEEANSLAAKEEDLELQQTHNNDSYSVIVKQFLVFLGPAVLVSVGYVDPGNWATDIEGGSVYGYSLLWVLVLSNLIAILLQTLCARLGLVTGKDLAQQCANFYPPVVSIILWILAELAITATDLAEVLGTAIGLNLLLRIPLIWGVLLTSCDTLLFLLFTRVGPKFTEIFIFVLMSVISLCFVAEMVISKPSVTGIVSGLVPRISSGSLTVATGMLGATVMPHNLYLHSGLMVPKAQVNDKKYTNRYCKFAFIDSVMSLNLALFVNAAILIVSCASFYGKQEITMIQQAHSMLKTLFGSAAAIVFGTALLLSGQSSTITGTLAGQIIMEGFIQFTMRPWLRRMLTRGLAIIPAALVILIFGDLNGTSLLLWSQVILSIQLPFAMIPLLRITSHAEMGEYKNRFFVKFLGWNCVLFVVALNVWLIIEAFRGKFTQAPTGIWVLAIALFLLFLSALVYITFCKIEPKESRLSVSSPSSVEEKVGSPSLPQHRELTTVAEPGTLESPSQETS